uniref:Uncharacterized protein n=1 Tax=Octopus bimaculoides TaxID=37653 RepID=A0A0L8FQT3_OCTBM
MTALPLIPVKTNHKWLRRPGTGFKWLSFLSDHQTTEQLSMVTRLCFFDISKDKYHHHKSMGNDNGEQKTVFTCLSHFMRHLKVHPIYGICISDDWLIFFKLVLQIVGL